MITRLALVILLRRYWELLWISAVFNSLIRLVILSKTTREPFSITTTPRAMARWVFPLWKAFHNGKTHLAIGLGIKACLSGYKVLFVTVPLLINQLKESRSQQILTRMEGKFEKYDLVIADELGYISFDKEGSELLFTHLSLRAGRKSTIITTNLSFDRWEEIFSDAVMTAAMIDRLTHKSYLLNMNGNSYRLKETKEWLAGQEEEKDELN